MGTELRQRQPAEVVGPSQVLVFEVEQQRYAVPASLVVEIVRAVAVSPLPRAPAVVRGVVNVRGLLAPLLDLRRRFGWPDKAVDPWEHFLLLRGPRRPVLVRADRVVGLVSIDAGQVEPARAVVPGAEYVAGLIKRPDGLFLLYDFPSFVSEAETLDLERALAETSA